MAQAVAGATPVLRDTDLLLHEHREWGLSCYDVHADGSGVAHSTRLRPMLNMRPTHRYHVGAWQLPADLAVVSWLDDQRVEFDVVTDDDLDRQGADLLAPYRCVISGTHPEYYTDSDVGRRRAVARRAADASSTSAPTASTGARRTTRSAAPGRAPPRPRRLAGVGVAAGRGPLRQHRRARWPVAQPRAQPTAVDRSRVCGAGFRPLQPLPAARRQAMIHELRSSSRASSPKCSARRETSAAGPRVRRSTASIPPSDRPATPCCSPRASAVRRVPALCRGDRVHGRPARAACSTRPCAPTSSTTSARVGSAVFATGSIAWSGSLTVDADVSRITANVITRFRDPATLTGETAHAP